MKHSHLKKSVTFIRKYFWPKALAKREAAIEISMKNGYIKILTLITILGAVGASIIYMPINGIDYGDNLFPFIDFLGYVDISENLKMCLVITIYPLTFPMCYSVAFFGVILSFYVSNLMIQVGIYI